MRNLSETEHAAFLHALTEAKTGPLFIATVSDIARFLNKPTEELTAEDLRAAYDEAVIAAHVEHYKAAMLGRMRAVGEQLTEMPLERQQLLLQIPSLTPDKLERVVAIVQEETRGENPSEGEGEAQ